MPPRPSRPPLIFIAWLLRETRTIKLGTGTLNLPNRHPATVAAEVAMLDHMAQRPLHPRHQPGRPPLGCRGLRQPGRRPDRDVRRGDRPDPGDLGGLPPYDLEGRFWTISTARTLIPELGQGTIAKPYQKPHPPIVVTAVAPFSKGVTAAAARGFDPISANFLQPNGSKPTGRTTSKAAARPAARPTLRTGGSPKASSSPTTPRPPAATRPTPPAPIFSTTTPSSPSSNAAAARTSSRPTPPRPMIP